MRRAHPTRSAFPLPLLHGAFFGVGSTVAAGLVPANRRAAGHRADVHDALAMDLPLVQLPLLAAALALLVAGVLASTTFNPRITRTRRTP